jgi:rare lipoprotein A
MKKLVMGCVMAGMITLSPESEARLPASVALPLAFSQAKLEFGLASWYGEECHGNPTASGEVFDMQGLTAAHRELPLGTKIKVTNLLNSRSLVLQVNDRGPNIPGRVVDLSAAAAERLGFIGRGVAPVQIEVMACPKDYHCAYIWQNRAAKGRTAKPD